MPDDNIPVTVCIRGHIVDDSYNRCPEDGQPVLTACLYCRTQIYARSATFGGVQMYQQNCPKCGSAYPWKAQNEDDRLNKLWARVDDLEKGERGFKGSIEGLGNSIATLDGYISGIKTKFRKAYRRVLVVGGAILFILLLICATYVAYVANEPPAGQVVSFWKRMQDGFMWFGLAVALWVFVFSIFWFGWRWSFDRVMGKN